MPHATEFSDAQDAQDDILIQQVLDPQNPQNPLDISRELEPGEKADDAVDYGDLSDDDLADEEDISRVDLPESEQQGRVHESLVEFTNGADNQIMDGDEAFGEELDELFGDTPQSPSDNSGKAHQDSVSGSLQQLESFESGQYDVHDGYQQEAFDVYAAGRQTAEIIRPQSLQVLETQTVSKEEQMQQYLFSMSRHGATNQESLFDAPRDEERVQDLATLWPKFEQHSVPRFMDLLPLKKSYYIGKKPSKQPKPVYPTKLNLDLAHDQEKQFRLTASPQKKSYMGDGHLGVVKIAPISHSDVDRLEESPSLSDSDNETVGGVTWRDLQILCEDWENQKLQESTESDMDSSPENTKHGLDVEEHNLATGDSDWGLPPAKVNYNCIPLSYVLRRCRDERLVAAVGTFFDRISSLSQP